MTGPKIISEKSLVKNRVVEIYVKDPLSIEGDPATDPSKNPFYVYSFFARRDWIINLSLHLPGLRVLTPRAGLP